MAARAQGKGWTGAGKVKVARGNSPIPPRPLNIGTLEGSWYDMGFQYGQRAGEYIRYCFNDEWPGTKFLGTEHIISDLHRWEQTTLVHLCPHLIEMLKGLADGAAPELDKSPYTEELSHYEKILYRHYHLELLAGHPLPDKHTIRPPGYRPTDSSPLAEPEACRCFAVLGSDNRMGKTLHVDYREGGYLGTFWSVVYTARPSDPRANSWWAISGSGTIIGNGGVNEKGVAINYNASSTAYAPEFDWGLSMSLGAAWALPFANTTEEAIDLLAHGSPEYREKTGRKTLLRGCCLYMISDPELTCIFESATHHYGVRYPGDIGEAGNYVCASNNDWCAYSYDDEDKFNTTEPMTKFGHVSAAPASLVRVTVDGRQSNWYRFWTLMEWCQHNYLNIDIASIQAFSTSHFYCDKNGARSDYFRDPTTGEWVEAKYSGFSLCQHQPLPDDHARGTKDVTIYELSKDGVNIYQAWGRPCEWDGPWDEYTPFKT